MRYAHREKGMILFLLVIICAFSYAVYHKEKLKSEGLSILLALAPADPRSLIQGDYMRLRYVLETKINQALSSSKDQVLVGKNRENQINDTLIISLDKYQVAQFLRFDNGKPLSDHEYYLKVKRKRKLIKIKPHSFMFQEGYATYYQAAKYGMFRLDPSGKMLLIGLADQEYKEIIPAEKIRLEEAQK